MGVVFHMNDPETLKKIADEQNDPRMMERATLEPLRKMLVHCMKEGAPLIINIDRMTPDFWEKYNLEEENFPADIIFDQQEWLKEENHAKIVRSHENYSLGGLHKG